MTATFQTSIFSQKWRVWRLWPAWPLWAHALALQLWCSSRDTPAIRSSDKSTPVFVCLLSAAVTGGAGQVLLVKMAISWEKSTSTHLSSLPKCRHSVLPCRWPDSWAHHPFPGAGAQSGWVSVTLPMLAPLPPTPKPGVSSWLSAGSFVTSLLLMCGGTLIS